MVPKNPEVSQSALLRVFFRKTQETDLVNLTGEGWGVFQKWQLSKKQSVINLTTLRLLCCFIELLVASACVQTQCSPLGPVKGLDGGISPVKSDEVNLL